MGKFADKYFAVAPWEVRENGFNPAYSEVSESVFSLANEYMGLRGYFEEGYSGESLQGSYVNGVYERRSVPPGAYRGMLKSTEFMLNTVDWVYTRIVCNGEALDLAKSNFENFERGLDLKTGVLTRRFVWNVGDGARLELSFERFLSMVRPHIGAQRIAIKALEGVADMAISAGLDFTRLHMSMGQNFWDCSGAFADGNFCEVTGTTKNTAQTLRALAVFRGLDGSSSPEINSMRPENVFRLKLKRGQSAALERIAALDKATDFTKRSVLEGLYYKSLKEESAAWWVKQWRLSDIEIDGDEENQQGIRFCIFQMHQTLHTAGQSAVIGAKGLTGEFYNGNAFWDTEVYCLPFYLFSNPAAARNILQFRYDTLGEAKKRAQELDCKGAYYPIATISGRECCDLWQHANLQLQPSTGLVYGLWNYARISGDTEFLYNQGAEILVEVCRMLASRGNYSQNGESYGFYGVMGPDEFHLMVNNNCYTNYMGKKSFEFALEVLEKLREQGGGRYEALAEKLGLTSGEEAGWADMAHKMRISRDVESGLFEQHDGFYSLPHTDIKSIPAEEFPLYSHWAYDRIYRSDMLKQPDVLMFMLMYNSEFTKRQIETNFDYYEPRCIHESSLSPSVHSILAAQIGRMEQAYGFFRFAARMDLDNYNRNTREGLHITSIAGSWMNIVYGFGGLRSDGERLSLAPVKPEGWRAYSFALQIRGQVLRVNINENLVTLSADGDGIEIDLYGETVHVGRQGMTAALGGKR
ncbi:MAG: family 65 glycosyl hydrolase [Oscillospiraceae bacterium]|jgi:maltose phosphorylase|nr:family 65 glycosyl hydrolase [Oscillospiraceae bacterium]